MKKHHSYKKKRVKDGEEDEHTYFPYKHPFYWNQINNSRFKAIYLSVISSYKVNNGWRKR